MLASRLNRLCRQVLERATLHHAAHADDLPDSVDALLAVLACARAEVLWWFRHWGEVHWRSDWPEFPCFTLCNCCPTSAPLATLARSRECSHWYRGALHCMQGVPQTLFRSLLSAAKPLQSLAAKDGVGSLLGAMAAAADLLLTHRHAAQHCADSEPVPNDSHDAKLQPHVHA